VTVLLVYSWQSSVSPWEQTPQQMHVGSPPEEVTWTIRSRRTLLWHDTQADEMSRVQTVAGTTQWRHCRQPAGKQHLLPLLRFPKV